MGIFVSFFSGYALVKVQHFFMLLTITFGASLGLSAYFYCQVWMNGEDA